MRIFRPFALLFCGLFACGLGGSRAWADSASDLAKYSAFPRVGAADVSHGKVLTARSPGLSSARDLSIQALYVINAPVAKTLEMHKQWDSTRHPELKVYLHRDLPGQPAPANFTADIPGNGAARELAAATRKLPDLGGLQLSKDEANSFHPGGDVAHGAFPAGVRDFWSQVLYKRCLGFVKSGLSGLPPYEANGGGAIRPADEMGRLLREQPNVRAVFQPVIAGSGLAGGAASLPPSLYWELFDVQGQANFSLGAAFSRASGDSAQLLDLQYYASGGYYVFATFYQMWPITMDNHPATLVWRVDCLSSAALEELHGMERLGSGAAMMKDILRTINLFQKDMGR